MWKSMITKIIDNIETISIYSLQNKQTNKQAYEGRLFGRNFFHSNFHKGDKNTNFPWPAKVSTLFLYFLEKNVALSGR